MLRTISLKAISFKRNIQPSELISYGTKTFTFTRTFICNLQIAQRAIELMTVFE